MEWAAPRASVSVRTEKHFGPVENLQEFFESVFLLRYQFREVTENVQAGSRLVKVAPWYPAIARRITKARPLIG